MRFWKRSAKPQEPASQGPGWYQLTTDPPGCLRWWDGAQWTANVRDTRVANPVGQDARPRTVPPWRQVPEPTDNTFEVWGQRGWHNFNVVGESFHSREIRALMRGVGNNAEEVTVPVRLIREPTNRHDPNAIAVHSRTGALGHLSRDDAARYAAPLDRLRAEGLVAATTARVWSAERNDFYTGKKQFVGSVRIDLPEPHMLMPVNAAPTAPHVVLPSGSAIQVLGEEEHMGSLGPFLNDQGECWVHATLDEVTEPGPRSNRTTVIVLIEGNSVGHLGPKLSSDMLPAVRYLAERGFATCVRAIVKGNRLKADVVLYSARSHELTNEWFNSFGDGPRSASTAPGTPGETSNR